LKKAGLLLALVLMLSGCATYQFQKGPAPYDKGYVASYDGKPIPEFTLGKDNSVPDLALAKERFNRRRLTVEYYYKKMGQMETRLKAYLWDPPVMFVDFLGGLLRWPFVAADDYKYNHNPQYKEKIDRLDEQTDELEKARVNSLKAKLKVYIDEDLAKEPAQKNPPVSQAVATSQQVPVAEVPAAHVVEIPAVSVEPKKSQPVKPEPEKQMATEEVKVSTLPATVIPSEVKPVVVQEEKKVLPAQPIKLESPVAVIIAKPAKGLSPLQVNFNGGKSYSKSAKIVSYTWDFGDGDTSTKKNPLNTYWSTTYGSRIFTATLTVKDEKGQTASASTDIEVIAK